MEENQARPGLQRSEMALLAQLDRLLGMRSWKPLQLNNIFIIVGANNGGMQGGNNVWLHALGWI